MLLLTGTVSVVVVALSLGTVSVVVVAPSHVGVGCMLLWTAEVAVVVFSL